MEKLDVQMRTIVSENKLLASLCRDSFYFFFKQFWETVPGCPPTPSLNWHIQYQCEEAQYAAERVFLGLPKYYDIVVNISPGTTKSTIWSILFQAWTWTRMPSARHICGSHTENLILDLSRKCRDVVASDKYRALFPEIKLREDQNTKGYFANTLGGDRFSCTIGGKTPMGMHAHFIGVDDPIDPQRAMSDQEIKNANDWLDSTIPSRKVDKAVTLTVLVMQRLRQGDPTDAMLESGNPVKHICIPAEVYEGVVVKPEELRSKYKNGLMDPVRLPKNVLQEAQKRGEYHYAGQYLQSPTPIGGGMFKVDNLHIEPMPANQGKFFKRWYRYWDKAATLGGGDYTVGVLMAEDINECIWILDVVRGQWDSATREKIILLTAQQDKFRTIVGIEQEPGSSGKDSAQQTIKKLKGFRVIANTTSSEGGKIVRADSFSVQVNSGNVYLAQAEWNRDYINELKHFPNSRYKDQVDASSGAFNLMTKKNVRKMSTKTKSLRTYAISSYKPR